MAPAEKLLAVKQNAQKRAQQLMSKPTPSVRSAPAATRFPTPARCVNGTVVEEATPGEPCLQGDCLFPDSLVWLEGQAAPKALKEVIAGQKILCYDRLGGHLKHAPILQIHTDTGDVEWTKLTLEDGTQLELTADHPVRPAENRGGDQQPQGPFACTDACVKAGSLRPGEDRLLVLKVVPVLVKKVETRPVDSPHVFVSILHPERHAVFVAAAGGKAGAFSQPIAVESSNAHALASMEALSANIRNTFIHVPSQKQLKVKSASAPPSLHGEVEVANLPGTPMGSPTDRYQNTDPSSCDSHSTCNSAISNGENLVVLGGPMVPEWAFAGDLRTHIVGASSGSLRQHASLLDYRGVQASGLASIGSLKHSEDQCNCCLFENRRQHFGFKPCYKGVMCERCHEDHDVYKKWKGKQLHKAAVETQPALAEGNEN